jgi:hypothetical protein
MHNPKFRHPSYIKYFTEYLIFHYLRIISFLSREKGKAIEFILHKLCLVSWKVQRMTTVWDFQSIARIFVIMTNVLVNHIEIVAGNKGSKI